LARYPKRRCGPFTSLTLRLLASDERGIMSSAQRPAPAAECLMKDKQRPSPKAPAGALDLRAAPEHTARNGRHALPRSARQGIGTTRRWRSLILAATSRIQKEFVKNPKKDRFD